MAVQRGNVDNEEDLRLLVSYQKCLSNKFKACEKESKAIKDSLKEKLQKELFVRNVASMPDLPPEEVKDELIYDLAGYLLHTRTTVTECEKCRKGLQTKLEELPETFLAADYTAKRTRGGLKFVTVEFFKIIQVVEEVLSKHFESKEHVYLEKSYETVIEQICEQNLSNPCCDNHPESLAYLITEYIHIRFHLESTRYRNLYLLKERSVSHANKKKSKI